MRDEAESIKSFASFNPYPVISLISFNKPILFIIKLYLFFVYELSLGGTILLWRIIYFYRIF